MFLSCILILGPENVVTTDELLKLSLIFLSLSLCLLTCQVRHYKPTHKYEQNKGMNEQMGGGLVYTLHTVEE